jgi:cytidylate kinase
MKKITIAIDGFSSTGKSTVAKQLANALGYVYVDSGAMYRVVAWYAMQNKLIEANYFNSEQLIKQLNDIQISFSFNKNSGFAEVYLNGQNVEKEIRTLEVSRFVSQVATIPEVRKQLVQQQQSMGDQKGVVMDGRDIGTVVFPNAELKLFMTASAKTRAIRRYDELIQRGDPVTFDEVLENIKSRDYIDSTRKDSPLLKAKDAIEIDNSNLSLKEQFDKVYTLALKKINED